MAQNTPIPPDFAGLAQAFEDTLVQKTLDHKWLDDANAAVAISDPAFEQARASLLSYVQNPPAPSAATSTPMPPPPGIVPAPMPPTPEAVRGAVKVLTAHADAITMKPA